MFQVSLSGGDKVAAALGETAVDYCVGRPVDNGDQLEAEAAVWPVFVLWADGGVFCVQTGAVDGGRWTVQGPIDVFPEQETDYSQVMDIGCTSIYCRQFSLLILTSFFGQFIDPVGEEGMGVKLVDWGDLMTIN